MNGLAPEGSSFAQIVGNLIGFFDVIVGFIISLIMTYLVWRVVATWIVGGGDEASIAKGKQTVIVGFVVLVVVFGLWGIVRIVRTTVFGV